MIAEQWVTSAARRPVLHDLARWTRSRWLPLAIALVFAHFALLGPFLLSEGVPRGGDMGVNLVNGSVAQNGTWHQLWDDTRYPGQAKHVSRFGLGDLALSKLAWLTGDITVAVRIMVWAFHIAALLGMYLYVSRVTGSRWAGALAAVVLVFSTGAPFRAIMAMIAGFALLPLLFFAVDRLLEAPGIKRALLLAIVLALYGVTSIPPFTYIVALALVVYVAFFLASRAVAIAAGRADVGLTARVLLYGGLSLLVALPLAAYFITGLTISTAQLLEETGGYDLESLQSGRPSFYEAITFQRGTPEMNTLPMAVAAWALAGLAIASPFFVRTWRVFALVTIAFVALLFASDTPNPLYNFMYDHFPYFSSVRGTRRWTSLTLFGFAGTAGIIVAYGAAWARTHWGSVSLRGRACRNTAIGVAAAGSVIAVAAIAFQLSAVRQWLAPYPLDSEFTAPYEFLQSEEPGTVYAPTPFLGKRLKDDDFAIGVAHGKKAGPGISGQPAFGVFQSGGKEVNTEIFDLVSSMKTYPANLFPLEDLGEVPLSLADRQNRGPRNVKNFFLAGDITLQSGGLADSAIRVTFHRFKVGEGTGYHALDIYPAAGRVQFMSVSGDQQTVLASGASSSFQSGPFYIEVMSFDDRFGVWVDGQQVLSAPLDKYSGSDVMISAAEDLDARFEDGELNIITGDLDADYSLTGLLSLFRVKYLVIQPNTTEFERQRLMSVPGLSFVQQWGDSALYKNDYYTPGNAFFSPAYGVYRGDGVALTRALYKIDPVAQSKLPLIALDDIPLELRADVLANASFIAADLTGYPAGSGEGDVVVAKVFSPLQNSLAPNLYSWDLNADNLIIADPESFKTLSMSTGVPLELGRGRNFVFDTSLFPPADSMEHQDFLLRFRVRPDGRYYELRVDPSGSAQLELYRPSGAKVLATGRFTAIEGAGINMRVSAIDNRIGVWLNDRRVIDFFDETIDKGGPIVAISLGDGVYLGPRSMVAGDVSLVGFETLAEEGFTDTAISSRSNVLTAAQIASLGHAVTFTTSLEGMSGGTYRALISGAGEHTGNVSLTLVSGSRSRQLLLETPDWSDDEWLTAPGVPRWHLVSEPVTITGGEELLLTSESHDVTLGQLLLAEDVNDSAALRSLLDPSASSTVPLDKDSSSHYSGSIGGGQPGVLIFQDAYHNGWKASLGDEQLPHFSAFGSLNGYWVPGDEAGELVVKFGPQARYMRGLAISTVAFVLVLLALLAVIVWEGGFRDSPAGQRISEKVNAALIRMRQLPGRPWRRRHAPPAGVS